jgi:hypothetical protein
VKLQVRWNVPLSMRAARQSLIYSVDLAKIPRASGVYVFGRRYGDEFEALYVGKALNIQGRVKGQLNNLRLMQHVRTAKSGRRFLLVGTVVTRPGQQIDRVLPLVERALIRHFLSEGHDLANIQGTLLRRHEVVSTRRPRPLHLPRTMYVEMNR